VAIVQISQITNRKGLAENLPQLAGAELGWSTDTRQLWIGNGTLQDGAPVIGNTEILTEFSDILAFTNTYTYEGLAAGYAVQTGATAGTPVTLSLQSWLDQWASVLDFGAVGDGVTDDTAAINRALQQLYCRESNPQIRRALFFPAGVYRITSAINIPPYATLYGEGIEGSVIALDSGSTDYVARTADSNQNTGANIGSGGATPPQSITITNMGFQNNNTASSVFLVQDATNCRFQNVSFAGPGTKSTLTDNTAGTMGVDFASTTSYVCDQIVFDGCLFTGTTYACATTQQIKGVTFSNSNLNILYQGFNLSGTGPTGVRMVHNLFDNIYAQGIFIGTATLNASGHNIFYDVGNGFNGSGNPISTIIEIQNSNNVSISDLFARSDADAASYVRINLNNTSSIATTNGEQLAMGAYTRQSGIQAPLTNNVAVTVTTLNASVAQAFSINYTITRSTAYRTGTLVITANNGSGNPTWSDDYVQNGDTGITLSVTQSGTAITVTATADNSGGNGFINYSTNYLA
jgi:Pectate lyase superfamily protein